MQKAKSKKQTGPPEGGTENNHPPTRESSHWPHARTNETKRFPGWGSHKGSGPPTSDNCNTTLVIFLESPSRIKRPHTCKLRVYYCRQGPYCWLLNSISFVCFFACLLGLLLFQSLFMLHAHTQTKTLTKKTRKKKRCLTDLPLQKSLWFFVSTGSGK